jgi:hypothetical protein
MVVNAEFFVAARRHDGGNLLSGREKSDSLGVEGDLREPGSEI